MKGLELWVFVCGSKSSLARRDLGERTLLCILQ